MAKAKVNITIRKTTQKDIKYFAKKQKKSFSLMMDEMAEKGIAATREELESNIIGTP